jgi:hypothetical protein
MGAALVCQAGGHRPYQKTARTNLKDMTPTDFARLKDQGFGQQHWQDRHIFCVQNQDASGEAAFISAAR